MRERVRAVRALPPRALLFPATAAAASVAMAAERAVLVARGIPTGNDESVYALMAWRWAGRLEAATASSHRFRGTGAILFPAVAVTERIWVHRLLFVAIGVAMLLAVFLIGRLFLGKWIAGWSALMLGLLWVHVFQSTQILPDVAASLGAVLVLLVYWHRVARRAPDERLKGLWPIGALLGAVFFVQPAFAVVGGLVVALDFALHRPRDIWSRATLGAVAGLGVFLVPYFIRVWMDHGSPFFLLGWSLSGSKTLGAPIAGGNPGYVDYSNWFFDSEHLFGPALGAAIIAGAVTVLVAVITGWPVPRRDARLLTIWMVVPSVTMALLFHAEERYQLVGMSAMFLSLGVLARAVLDGLSRAVRRPAWISPAIVAAAALAALPLFGGSQYALASDRVARHIKNEGFVHKVARALGERSEHPCQVFTKYRTQFNLVTGCVSHRYRATEASARDFAASFDGPTYFAWFERGTDQPAYLGRFLSAEAQLVERIPSRTFLRTASLYRYTGPKPAQSGGG